MTSDAIVMARKKTISSRRSITRDTWREGEEGQYITVVHGNNMWSKYVVGTLYHPFVWKSQGYKD